MAQLPSITALSVAIGYSLCSKSKEYSHLVDPSKAQLLEFVINKVMPMYPTSLGFLLFKLGGYLSTETQSKLLDTFGAQGYIVHMGMRKLMIEQEICRAIDNGVKQVIICGAGYDITSLYLHKKYNDVTFFELDLGETQIYKLKALNDLQEKLDFNKLKFIQCDLSENTWHSTLANNGFDSTKPAIVICEGFTPYLEKKSITVFLKILQKHILNHPDSKLVISFINKDDDTSKVAKFILKSNKEEYKCNINLEDVPKFLNQYDLSIEKYITRKDFQEQANNDKVVEFINAHPGIQENYFVVKPKTNEQLDINDIEKIIVDIPKKKCILKNRNNIIWMVMIYISFIGVVLLLARILSSVH